jgi:hypothetical protein
MYLQTRSPPEPTCIVLVSEKAVTFHISLVIQCPVV